MMAKAFKLKQIRIKSVFLVALMLTSCTHDLGEHDVGMVERKKNSDLDPNVNYCEHHFGYDFPMNRTSSTAYNSTEYHYVYCTMYEEYENCLFTPTFEKHTLIEDTSRARYRVVLYNNQPYEAIPQKCSECGFAGADKYIRIEETVK